MTTLSSLREETPSEAASPCASTRPSVTADRMLAELLAAKVTAGTASADEKAMFNGLLQKFEAAKAESGSSEPAAKMPSASLGRGATSPSAEEKMPSLRAEANLLGSKIRTGTATREEAEKLEAVLARLEAANAEAAKLTKLRSATVEAEAKLRTVEAANESKIKETKVKEMMALLKELDRVELCFLLDATMSMGPYIDAVKNKIMLIVKELRAANPMMSLRGAISAYRDPLEPRGGENVSMDFVELMSEGQTTDAGFKAFEQFLGGVHPGAGGDFCEDVAGGLKNMLALSWCKQTPTKVVFHISDAPCHGNKFHGPNLGDNHGAGDHDIIGLLHQARKLNVHYYFGKLTDHTDIMIDEFNKAMAGSMAEAGADFVQVSPLSAPGALVGSVTKAVRESLTSSKKESKKLMAGAGKLGGGGVDMSEIDKMLAKHGL